MKVKIKRIDNTLPMPEYHTSGAVAFDFYARETTEIKPHEIKLIPANFIIQTPPGYMLLVASRSSTPIKKGLTLGNGIGIIDNDFCGPEDEIRIQVYNFTENPVIVERGERIAQGVFVKIDRGDWEELAEMSAPTRGGFGTTGN